MTRRWGLPGLIALVGLGDSVWLLHSGATVSAVAALIALVAVAGLCSPLAFPRSAPGMTARVVVYWRPGCQYCLRLRWSLGRQARRARWVDIWSDDSARAYVRSVNDGDETVPTVVVDGEVRVNPSVGWVRRALADR